MLTFYGVVKIKKEKISLLKEAAAPFLEKVTKEDGILDFRFYQNKEDPTWFLAHEIYQDEEALKKHYETQHLDVFAKVLFDSLEEYPVRGFWEEIGSIER